MLHRENTKANSRGLSSYLGLPDVRAVLRHGGVDSRRRAIPRGPTMHAPTSLLTHPLLTQSSLLNRFPGPNRRSRRGSTAATTSAPSPHTVSTKEVGRDLDVPLTMRTRKFYSPSAVEADQCGGCYASWPGSSRRRSTVSARARE